MVLGKPVTELELLESLPSTELLAPLHGSTKPVERNLLPSSYKVLVRRP